MRTLPELMEAPKELEYLRERGIFFDVEAFEEALVPIASCALFRELTFPEGQAESRIVWGGQQLYVDYRRSVTKKMELLTELNQRDGVGAFFLCSDTDRSGSDKAITTIQWPLPRATGNMKVVKAKAAKHVETRYVPSGLPRRQEAARVLEVYLRQTVDDFARVEPRFERFKELLLEEECTTLAELNLSITHLLMEHMGLCVPTTRLSTILQHGCLDHSVDLWLRHREACVSAFNEAIDELEAMEINPMVRRLPDDYLPLNYSCEVDRSRIRLRYQRQGDEHFAVGQSVAGREVRFSLGVGDDLTCEALRETGRWSPDVSLPIFLNDVVSGCVVGKSSALYGLVLNRVIERGLGQRRVPMLVPNFSGDVPCPAEDSVLYEYLTSP